MSPFFSRSWLAIAVQSLTGSVQFYQTLLGDGAIFRQTGKYVEFDLGDLRLGLFEPKPESASEFDQRGQNPMSLCLAVTDLDQTLAQLAAQSLIPDQPPSIYLASHGQELYLFDPDGNRIILYESKKR
jgi:predicted enzyme related to lactoylglutathione lyase